VASTGWARLAVVLSVVLAAGATGAASAGTAGGADSPATPAQAGPRSIVQLGDSVAAGEGTLYGYRYVHGEWTGGNLNVKWDPPYGGCHDSKYAYVHRVAGHFGKQTTVAQFACTGATFASGISAPEVSDGTTLRPAEFGNWDTQQGLNPQYDAAKPDLVLITLGADDVQFVHIVEGCIANGYEYALDLASLECTQANPGSTIQQDYFDFLPKLEQNYATLVRWIEARARAHQDPVPKIVFTTYPSPLPPAGGPKGCADVNLLYGQQVRYLSSLVGQLDRLITSTVQGLKDPNVGVADVSGAYTPGGSDHRWCSRDPWSYGLSIYHLLSPSSFESQAPFHPTPKGQASIASLVLPTVERLFSSSPTTTRATSKTAAVGARTVQSPHSPTSG
jgi:lysophospholipase L1-like esterase